MQFVSKQEWWNLSCLVRPFFIYLFIIFLLPVYSILFFLSLGYIECSHVYCKRCALRWALRSSLPSQTWERIALGFARTLDRGHGDIPFDCPICRRCCYIPLKQPKARKERDWKKNTSFRMWALSTLVVAFDFLVIVYIVFLTFVTRHCK